MFFRHLYTLDKTSVNKKLDQTLEIIMTDMDPEKMNIFYQECSNSAAEATKVYCCGIRYCLKMFLVFSFPSRKLALINCFQMPRFLIIYSNLVDIR